MVEDMDSAKEVSTVFVAGLPADATHRELENSVRFLPGYEAFKFSIAKGKGGGVSMFVKFQAATFARAAVELLNGVAFDTSYPDVPMRVEIARSDMKSPSASGAPQNHYREPPSDHRPSRGGGPPPYGMVPPPAASRYELMDWGDGYGSGPSPRKRGHSDGAADGIDTIVLLGQTEKGYSERQLEEFFISVPGFTAWKANAKVGGGFVKFSSARLAREAIDIAAQSGIEAQMARSSMTGGDRGEFQPPPPPMHEHPVYGYTDRDWYEPRGGRRGQPPPPTYLPNFAGAPPPKKSRTEASGEKDTLVLLGALEKGYSEEQLEDFFRQQSGFVAFKANSRVGGAFVKFATAELAHEAKEAAENNGLEASFARQSMNA